ncbi:MAG: exopolygalacturonase [Bacteroidaceae bacterium]|nr:exopolygalacturonase [Bacteroidaceae bacterium]
MRYIALFVSVLMSVQTFGQELFPDGTPIPAWFNDYQTVDVSTLGKSYEITDFGAMAGDSTLLQTESIQRTIDTAAANGGGVVVIPQGVYLSGAIFFKPGTHLYLSEGAVLKGSDDISHFPIKTTRIEGETCKYFTALVNADGLDGFTISGKGRIDGNGLRYWKAFWNRRSWNPKCTNKDEQRPRLVYISNCKNVQIAGVHLANSPFWSSHIYKCENVKYLGVRITSPKAPVKAPSTDAIDIDACTNVLVKNCYLSVNDDAIALKGGKGPWADKDPNNGGNSNIIIEDCVYGFCHSALTCGSESLHNRNIIFRRCRVNNAERLFWLKMRPDTPQHYEYITVEDIEGDANNFIYIRPWTQFFDLKDRKDMPKSRSNNITMRNIRFTCDAFFNVKGSEQYDLVDFNFSNLDIKARKTEFNKELVQSFTVEKVKVTPTE